MVDSASDPEQLKTEDPNKHVVDYLHYYCDPDNSFDFAVMLKGPWGAGKTYLIKNFLKERAHPGSEKKDLYVSLYGTTSIQQIEDGLYRQLHPILSSKVVMLVERATKGALKKAIGIDKDLSLRDYLDTPKDCLLVFDDLERCSVEITNALGYINHFVEHRGCKVIIFANEDDILSCEENIIDTKIGNCILDLGKMRCYPFRPLASNMIRSRLARPQLRSKSRRR